jgi:hypothetical protein
MWAVFVREQVIRPVPHRHLVFALPKVLRPAFRYRRRLLPKLALCAWKALSAATVSIQTAGEFLNWHPHLHVLAPAGAFRTDGSFVHSPVFNTVVLRDLFQANVLSLLLKERMISPELVERMKDWRNEGFHAYASEEIPDIEDALRVGLYMVRGPAATSCLRADPAQEPKVRYLPKGTVPNHGEERGSSGHQDYDYLEWIARLTSHIPDRGTQLVHTYGAYSNAHRGIAHKRKAFIAVPPEDEPSDPPRPDSTWLAARRNSWARLIRRVYEVDPLLCRCGERMRVVDFITQAPVIRKILDHIGRRFDPLKLPGRSPPLLDDFFPDPFPRTFGPQ